MKKEQLPVIIAGIFFFLALLGIGSGVYFYRQYKTNEQLLKNSESLLPLESRDLMAKVGKLIILPNEVPEIMTVADVEMLKKTQIFFQDALDGDKVLLFPNAGKAVMYRPSTNIIVNVAPIRAPQTSATSSGQLTPDKDKGPVLRIALRNGSGTTGITTKLEQELQTKMKNIQIMEKDNAKRMDYEKTLVIPLSNAVSKELIQLMADTLYASVSALPSDEPKPDAQFLIIAGKDRK